MISFDSMYAVIANAQQSPHLPYDLTDVTALFDLRSKLEGAEATRKMIRILCLLILNHQFRKILRLQIPQWLELLLGPVQSVKLLTPWSVFSHLSKGGNSQVVKLFVYGDFILR
jgi:hypothetical protein